MGTKPFFVSSCLNLDLHDRLQQGKIYKLLSMRIFLNADLHYNGKRNVPFYAINSNRL